MYLQTDYLSKDTTRLYVDESEHTVSLLLHIRDKSELFRVGLGLG